MSKSTQRYGRIAMSAKTSIDANPTLPPYILRQHEGLDKVAVEKYGLKYDLLDHVSKLIVHETIKDRKRGKQQQADLKEMELDYAEAFGG